MWLPAIRNNVILLKGDVKYDKRYGKQLVVETSSVLQARSEKGVKGFLKTLDGLNQGNINAIYSKYKDKSLDVLRDTPEELLSLGISQENLEKVIDSYLQSTGFREVITLLAPFSVKVSLARKIFAFFKKNTSYVIKHEPYKLRRVEGVSFELCEKIAKSDGIPPDDPERILAAVPYALEINEQLKGNTAVDAGEFITVLQQVLSDISLPVETAQKYIKAAVKRKEIVYNESLHLFQRDEMALAENVIAKRIIDISSFELDYPTDASGKVHEWEERSGITLHPQQKEAVIMGISNGVSVITGGPGRGKTTIAEAIVYVVKKYTDRKVCMLAPTGRAAKKLGESTGEDCHTIHSKCRIHEGITFVDEQDKIANTLVICDESSMLDTKVAAALLSNIEDGCQLIFVGDVDQLPSVGAGAVLRDLIASKTIPVVTLTKIYRQKGQSSIIPNAEKIRVGDTALTYDKDSFLFAETDDDVTSARWMLKLYQEKVAEFGKNEVCILSPHHHAKTASSVDVMNKNIQHITNPSGEELRFFDNVYRVGDLVMQIRNAEGIANGDIGVVTKIGGKSLEVTYADDKRVYEGDELDDLELVYAISIHKSQGSEYKCVIINMLTCHGRMLKRNLLYTAVTRAKKQCILIASNKALNEAISNEETNSRKTMLREKLVRNKEKLLSSTPFVA